MFHCREGETSGLGDYYILADRNRSSYLEEMLDNFDTYDAGFAWDRALRKTCAHTDTPFTPRESEIAAAVNRAVSQADAAFRNRDRVAAKAHLEAALDESQNHRRLHGERPSAHARMWLAPRASARARGMGTLGSYFLGGVE